MNEAIANIRKDYKLKSLLEEDVKKDPIEQFSIWWDEAVDSEITEVNAMTVATSTPDGVPAARIMLLKNFTNEGFIFFTNYLSGKGSTLAKNPYAALVFFWKELERQVRVEGTVSKVSEEESDAYFKSRPIGSRIGAWASPQSTPIAGRHIIEENVKKYSEQFGEEIPRPPHWGGFIVKPVKVEFWQGRSNRLHDRILYTRRNNQWSIERLAP
jgi:pyridoxamine 5'-phosphate oxidase